MNHSGNDRHRQAPYGAQRPEGSPTARGKLESHGVGTGTGVWAWGRRQRGDLGIAGALLLGAAIGGWVLCAQVPPLAYQFHSDAWFEGDLYRVMLAIADPAHGQATRRSELHPLFILFVNPPVSVLRALGWTQVRAGEAAVGGMAGLWVSTLFVVLRAMGLRRLDAVLFTLLGATSAASVFWLTVPETYALGSASILVALGVVAVSRHVKVPEWATVAASAATLSVTTTNWVAGIAAALVNHPLWRAIRVTVLALVVVVAAWGFQKLLYPEVNFFIGRLEEGSRQFLNPKAGGPVHILKSALLFSESMPAFEDIRRNLLSVQKVPLTALGVVGGIAAAGWALLLGLGAWALIAGRTSIRFRIALGLTLVAQLVLALLYGRETFLYALNLIVLLVPLAALAALTRLRPLALGLALVVSGCAAVNNLDRRSTAVTEAREMLREQALERED